MVLNVLQDFMDDLCRILSFSFSVFFTMDDDSTNQDGNFILKLLTVEKQIFAFGGVTLENEDY